MDVILKNISADETLDIRHRVLWPNKPKAFCQLEDDQNAWHFGGFVEGQLVCVASVFFTQGEARLRKFATLEEFQGLGIGGKMIRHILAELKQSDARLFWCDARTTAMDFYQRFGMGTTSEVFYKEEIPYQRMSLEL